MGVFSKTYYAPPGNTSIDDSEIAFVIILGVKREGIGQEDVDKTASVGNPPGNRQFKYISSLGRILFSADNPFAGPTEGRPNRLALERVFVLFKI